MLFPTRHRRLRRLLDAYVDGELHDPEAEELAAHLIECADCHRDADVTERIKSVLARLDDQTPTPLAIGRLSRFGGDLRSG